MQDIKYRVGWVQGTMNPLYYLFHFFCKSKPVQKVKFI